MSLESVEEVETAPSGSLEEVSATTSSPSGCDNHDSGAPKPRRKSLTRLRRRLSRTFRLSFSGSLSDFAHTFSIDERGEYPDSATSATKSLDAEDILPGAKINGTVSTKLADIPIYKVKSSHHVPSVQSRLRTISNLTRKLSLSNSRIIENPPNLASRLSSASSSSRINNNGIGK